ncbi:MAG TPA: MFS transporter [Candidatus Nitrosotenuis sp.]|nr:MFS transporter [Candidatus Nitrosotenuis sp.]
MTQESGASNSSWLNRTTLGIGLTSLLSDWSHEIATTVLPAFLASLGGGPGWLGIIEGTADGLSSFSKLGAGHYTDRLKRRKPLVQSGYLLTTLATGALALASSAYHVLLARASAWFGRGIRTPGRKALLAAGVAPDAYGRAFGFERMMDTLGAIVAPATALWLLQLTSHNYHHVMLWTMVPGVLAILAFGFLVREKPFERPAEKSFWVGLRDLPASFRKFLLAVGVFGLGDFSHTLLILFATQALTPAHGMAGAAGIAVGLYLLHNIFYAASAYMGGWLSDHVPSRRTVLAAGYSLAVVMAVVLAFQPASIPVLALAFALAGIVVGVEEALEDSLAAELVSEQQHGMAFGSLAAVNAVGDFVSSLVVGFLWSRYSASLAFSVAGVLFLIGAILAIRLPRTNA